MNDFAQVIQELDLLPLFAKESAGHLTRAEQLLTNLNAAADPAKELRPVLRTLHTIKSSASVLRLVSITASIHRIETVLMTVQDGVRTWNRAIADQVAAMIESLRQSISQVTETAADGALAATDRTGSASLPEATLKQDQSNEVVKQPQRMEYRVRFAAPHRAAATLTSKQRPCSTTEDHNFQSKVVSAPNNKLQNLEDPDQRSLRHLNRLIDQLPQIHQQIQRCCRPTDEGKLNLAMQWLELIHTELRKSLDTLESVPIGISWNGLPARLAELAASCGKQARLVVEGERTRLDRKRSQIIHGTITHLLTNAIDHGIESPQRRQELGKPAEATIRLRASHKRGELCIEFQDDGQGVDVARVRQKALHLGLATEAELACMSEPEITRMILEPRLSTATCVTTLSGRGLGLDAVRADVEQLGGTLEISSVHGRGTTIRMMIPDERVENQRLAAS